MSIDEVGQDAKLQVEDAISKIRLLPTEQITFLQYVWTSIQTFSCSIVETQSQRLRNIITEALSNTVQDFQKIAEATCMPRTQVLPEGIYYAGNIDLGITLNSLVQGVTALTSASATASCISNTALILKRKAITELFDQQGLMLNQLSSQSTQAINFLTYGAYMGTTSVMYLIYRTKDILGITERGGSRKKNTRKNKKHRKTYRKHKKKTKKNIKKSRKL
jgi:hypothetical protein